MKLHETIRNFYIRTIRPFFTVEVLSESGWSKVQSLNITEKTRLYNVKTKIHSLTCTENHILIDCDGAEVLAVESLGRYIKTDAGIEEVISVEKTDKVDNAYDLSLDEDTDHLYYCDGLLSHNCVICDEFAFLQKNLADKLFTSMFPVISSSKNGKFIIVSTPNGTDNLYYDIWQKANTKDARKNLDGWKAFTMWWWQVPGHDEAWKAKQIEAIGATRFAQEFNNEFLANSSTRKLVPDDILEQYRMRLSQYKSQGVSPKRQKILSETMDKVYEFSMWHEFDPKRAYLASADISEGVGGDSSVLYVWDVTDTAAVKMCASFSSNRASLVEFAFVASRILKLYCDPWLFAERNGVSAGMLDSLRITYGYGKIASESKNGEAGVYSHVSVKGKACLWAKEMLTTKGFGFVLYDKDLIDEMSTFVKKDTKGTHAVYQAANGAHDDCVMAFVWACWALSQELVDKYFVVCETFKSMYEQILPKTILPLESYREDDIKAARKDPLYADFLAFKDEAEGAWKKAAEAERKEDAADPFTYCQERDPYFGDEQPRLRQSVNPNNVMPAFFV